YIRIVGHNFYSLPLWTNQVDFIPEASWFEYSLTNRILGKTVGGPAESSRSELVKLLLASAYDYQKAELGNVAGDLTLQPNPRLRFHGDLSYNVTRELLQGYTTDMTFEIPRIVGTIGTRYNRIPPVIIPYFIQTPGTFNPGNELPSKLATDFLQGEAKIELLR